MHLQAWSMGVGQFNELGLAHRVFFEAASQSHDTNPKINKMACSNSWIRDMFLLEIPAPLEPGCPN